MIGESNLPCICKPIRPLNSEANLDEDDDKDNDQDGRTKDTECTVIAGSGFTTSSSSKGEVREPCIVV